MNKIKCPHCQQEFEIDESSYANILSQVRSQEFDKEIHDKLTQIDKQYETELKLSEEKFKNQAKQELAKKDTELIQLKAKKDDEINAIKIAAAEEISKLKSQLDNSNTEKALAVSQAIIPIEKERDRLKSDLKNQDTEAKIREQSLKDRYEGALQLKNEEIERLKKLKSKLSTKMVGETLEQHCEIEFNKLRATGFQNAYFEKDNEVSKTGSKGDYIYRETDENGTEIISIMF